MTGQRSLSIHTRGNPFLGKFERQTNRFPFIKEASGELLRYVVQVLYAASSSIYPLTVYTRSYRYRTISPPLSIWSLSLSISLAIHLTIFPSILHKRLHSIGQIENQLPAVMERCAQQQASIESRLKWASGANPALAAVLNNFNKAVNERKVLLLVSRLHIFLYRMPQ